MKALEYQVRRELMAIADELVLPSSLAECVAVAAFDEAWRKVVPLGCPTWDERGPIEYEAIKSVVESDAFRGRVTLFRSNDADALGQALAQLDADSAI